MITTHPAEPTHTDPKRIPGPTTAWLVAGLMAAELVLILWGIRGDLPLTPEVDETIFVTSPVRIAATGDLNPHWFGHPGSTMIYPLAAMFHSWNAVAHGGRIIAPDPAIQRLFARQPSDFYQLGRLLSALYATLSVPLAFLIGQRAFGRSTGILGAGLYVLSPIIIAHAQVLRTDSAAVFFTLLSLWCCLRIYERPSVTNQLAAGLAIGLAIATRYFMVGLIPILLAVDLLVLRHHRSNHTTRGVLLGALAIPIIFGLTTPFFVLDFPAARMSLRLEARNDQVGADGLTPLGNLWWYLSEAIPGAVTWPIALLGLLGLGRLLWRRDQQALLLAGFALLFLVEISVHSLHWQRWTIQILPLIAMFAAYALQQGSQALTGLIGARRMTRAVLLTGLALIAIWPASQIVFANIRLNRPSTRMEAHDWIRQNLAPGSRIAQEWFAAPLNPEDFVTYAVERRSAPLPAQPYELYERFSLAAGRTLDDYRREGYRYLITSSRQYDGYLSANQAQPRRYAREADFYRRLFAEAHLLQEFSPSTTRGGPTIRVYELRE